MTLQLLSSTASKAAQLKLQGKNICCLKERIQLFQYKCLHSVL